MATQRIGLLTAATLPDASGNAFFEPQSVKATNDLVNKLMGIFNDTATDLKLGFSVRVPKTYVGSPRIGGVFQMTATTGKYVFEVEYRAIADGEAGDPSTFQETVSTNPTAPATALNDQEASVALTPGNLAVDDRISGHLVRKGSDTVNDTMAAALMAHPEMFYFEYADA